MSYATLRYDVSGAGVGTIALDQPDTRNALSDELLGDLIAALQAARDDDAVRCVVLTSTHDRVRSASARARCSCASPASGSPIETSADPNELRACPSTTWWR